MVIVKDCTELTSAETTQLIRLYRQFYTESFYDGQVSTANAAHHVLTDTRRAGGFFVLNKEGETITHASLSYPLTSCDEIDTGLLEWIATNDHMPEDFLWGAWLVNVPDWRGRGVQKQIGETHRAEIAKRGFKGVILKILTTGEADAPAYFRKRGYQVIEGLGYEIAALNKTLSFETVVRMARS